MMTQNADCHGPVRLIRSLHHEVSFSHWGNLVGGIQVGYLLIARDKMTIKIKKGDYFTFLKYVDPALGLWIVFNSDLMIVSGP